MSAAVEHTYLYPFSSVLEKSGQRSQLKLATCSGAEKNPYFFQGRLIEPRRCADLLLALSLVSRTRFYSPKEAQRILAVADPVVTSDGEQLRLEAFSACCGVYAQLNLRGAAVDGEFVARGTTNVDFNTPMRTALASIAPSEEVRLHVGADLLELQRDSVRVVEKKVKLPVRWLKGFVEVQLYQSRLTPVFEVSAEAVRRFLPTLPQHQIWQKGAVSYVVQSGKGLRLSSRAVGTSVAVGASGRLRLLDPLLKHARSVKIYGGEEGVSGWEILADDASFFAVISPDAARGFSGEGQALAQLVNSGGDALAKVRAALQWQTVIDATMLAAQLQVEVGLVKEALALLGTRGLVGYDLAKGAYFHRELPFDLAQVEALQPRLLAARKLLDDGKVKISQRCEDRLEAYVKGTDVEHRVVVHGEKAQCTCLWQSRHPSERGACKHILAVQILSGSSDVSD